MTAWIRSEGRPGDSPFRRAQGLNAPVREAHGELYDALLLGPSPLSRTERRSLAVVVSMLNGSGY